MATKTKKRIGKKKPAKKAAMRAKKSKKLTIKKKSASRAVKRVKAKIAKKVYKKPAVKKKPAVSKIQKKPAKLAPKTTPRKPVTPFENKLLVGRVSHFFDKISVAVIEVVSPIRIGDKVSFEGPQTNFTQSIRSMQVEHKPIELASPGDDIGLKVDQPVKPKDLMYIV